MSFRAGRGRTSDLVVSYVHAKKLRVVENRIEQVVEPECSPQSGVTMLNNIVNNIEQCGQHNIVQSCFQQAVATHNFWPCT